MQAKITVKSVEALEPHPTRQAYLFDSELIGFGVRCQPGGRKTYIVQYRSRTGTKRRLTLGHVSHLRPAQARAMAFDILSAAAMGQDPAQERTAARRGMTVADLWALYENHTRGRKKESSRRHEAYQYAKHIGPKLGACRLQDLSRGAIAKWHGDMADTPVGANRLLAQLSSMLSLAVDAGHLAANPATGLKKYREQSRQRLLSADELRRLAEALQTLEADGRLSAGQAAAFRLLLLTGCRRGEILGARWGDVDFGRRILNLPDSKTGGRPVVLNKAAMAILDGLERSGPFICAGATPDKPITDIRKAWLRICKEAQLDNCNIHDLRHAFASTGAAQGVGLQIVGSLLGHRQASTTAKYSHLADNPLRAASEAIGDELAAFLNGPTAGIVRIEATPGEGDNSATEAKR